MPSFRSGVVTSIRSERQGLQRVEVDGERAYVLTKLIGRVDVGDRVVMNTTAGDLGLGTGGWHVVHWNLEREAWTEDGPGHIMKLRYTSLQIDSGAAEEAAGYVEGDLRNVGVVVCSVHSQVGVVAAVIKDHRPDARVAYVMTEGGALPLALSDLVHELRERGLLDVTVTAGQAFGGELEAVNVASGLCLSRAAGADIVIVGMGPGVVGTGTRLGTSALEVASLIDTVAGLDGRAIVAVRASGSDRRERHHGVSHHTLTALDLARSPAVVAVPPEASFVSDRHHVERAEPGDVTDILTRRGLHVTTMGRTPGEDPMFFRYAGAAAAVAANIAAR